MEVYHSYATHRMQCLHYECHELLALACIPKHTHVFENTTTGLLATVDLIISTCIMYGRPKRHVSQRVDQMLQLQLQPTGPCGHEHQAGPILFAIDLNMNLSVTEQSLSS